MKILFITNNYPTRKHPYFGVFVSDQRNDLIARGHTVDVCFMNSREGGYVQYFLGWIRLVFWNFRKYDIVHTHHTISAAILICAKPLGKFNSVHSYQNDPSHELGSLVRLHKLIYFFFNKIINKAITEFNQKEKVVYLPNGVDRGVFHPRDKLKSRLQLGLEVDKVYLLFVDSYKIRSQKRLDRFKEVVELCQQEINDICILMAVEVPRDLMPIYMTAADVHLITSDFEGSPNSVKEAILCGTKVVSTPVGDVIDAYKDVPHVRVSSSFDSSELAELVLQSIRNEVPKLESILEDIDFSNTAAVIKLEQLYEDILFQN